MQDSSKNKRIAKNTLLLYVRMLFLMLVNLYTSRIVLMTLGIEDYGIYNVVGGIVAMFGFISGTMTTSTQRYITYSLGENNPQKASMFFCTALQIHFIIALLVLFGGEIIGLWFLYHKLVIPIERFTAAFWVLQCTILSSAVMIISVPYNATIIAHEKMSAFAYISILEVILKLAIVYVLYIFSFDKLILYAFLMLLVQILIRFCYNSYCHRNFRETVYHHIWKKDLFRKMISFAGWNLFEISAGAMYTQGLNILLNIFFGPTVNAARAVAVQVLSTIRQFVGNFQMAINPQITKTYAQNQITDMHQLIYRSARFSFFLLYFITLPVIYETEFILRVWLHDVPTNTVTFLRIMICTSLIYTVANPLVIANQATGDIKKYQIVCGSLLLMILPFSYICLRCGLPPYTVFIVHFCMEAITQIARMIILKESIKLNIKQYMRSVYFKIFLVVILSFILPYIVHYKMNYGFLRFVLVTLSSITSVSVVTYILGLTTNERSFIKAKITSYTRRIFP